MVKAIPSESLMTPQAAQIGAALQAALAHHQSGRYTQAESLYRQVLKADPHNFDALHLLGVLCHQMGRHADAVDLISLAIQQSPEPFALNNLGEAYRAMNRFPEAEIYLRKAIALMPSYAEAHNNLALTLQAQNKVDEAEASYYQAISFKPDYAKAYHNLATLYKNRSQMRKALLCGQKTLTLYSADPSYWLLYADTIRLLSLDALDAVDISLLVHAFKKEHVDPQSLERVASALVCKDAAVASLLDCTNDADGGLARIEQAFSEGRLASLAGMPLLLVLLEEALITNYTLERLLRAVRHVLLLAIVPNKAAQLESTHWTNFIAALAQQCFANEYVYAVTAEEEAAAARLITDAQTILNQNTLCPAAALMLIGAYQALYRLPFAEKIPADGWPVQAQCVIVRQLIEPQQEEILKRGMPRFTAIQNQISQAVRQQYEENPYPRWRRRGNPSQGKTMQAGLQSRFPHQTFSGDSPQQPEILVAGCGTGSDAVQIANSFSNARILAVDMSLSSLAYAKRATQALGITGIEFGQADILELGALNKQFDVVVCSGVLHHMHDPLAGWHVLTQLLRPNGYMNIGLYSRRARIDITALRQLIKDAGYPSTLAGIRQFRTDALSGKCTVDIGSLSVSPDFYSVSACRDLVFHVQEHVVSPLEIQANLQQLGLQFIGFELPNPEARTLYLERFPDNPACDSLANWDAIEQDHPQIFAGMYQFWLKKI